MGRRSGGGDARSLAPVPVLVVAFVTGRRMVRYVLLVCDDESVELNAEEVAGRYAAYTACEDEMRARGVLIGRERLRPTSASTCVRVRDGQLLIADGPFAETKEQVAGYFVVDCADLDEAIELA
jgi:hypothetical protein